MNRRTLSGAHAVEDGITHGLDTGCEQRAYLTPLLVAAANARVRDVRHARRAAAAACQEGGANGQAIEHFELLPVV
jgi:hypothetical protein